MTVSLPVFNRNQGNILRSKLNAEQSKIELAAQEKQIVYDVSEAIREFELSRTSVIEFKKEVLPAMTKVRDTAFQLLGGGGRDQLRFSSIWKRSKTTTTKRAPVSRMRLVRASPRHACSTLNTAVGSRIIP